MMDGQPISGQQEKAQIGYLRMRRRFVNPARG